MLGGEEFAELASRALEAASRRDPRFLAYCVCIGDIPFDVWARRADRQVLDQLFTDYEEPLPVRGKARVGVFRVGGHTLYIVVLGIVEVRVLRG